MSRNSTTNINHHHWHLSDPLCIFLLVLCSIVVVLFISTVLICWCSGRKRRGAAIRDVEIAAVDMPKADFAADDEETQRKQMIQEAAAVVARVRAGRGRLQWRAGAMAGDVPMSPELEQIDCEIQDSFRALQNGLQTMDGITDCNKLAKQLEDLKGKVKECKRFIKEFGRILDDDESKNPPEIKKLLNDRKEFMIEEFNSYVILRKTYQSGLGNNNNNYNKRFELFDMGAGSSEPTAEENIQMASAVKNQQLIDAGRNQMDQTDQAIERSKMVVAQTVETGTQVAAALPQQIVQTQNKNIRDILHY